MVKYVLIILDIVPTRFYIGVMLFTACWVSYMMRVNMSINILEMVEVRASTSNKRYKYIILIIYNLTKTLPYFFTYSIFYF